MYFQLFFKNFHRFNASFYLAYQDYYFDIFLSIISWCFECVAYCLCYYNHRLLFASFMLELCFRCRFFYWDFSDSPWFCFVDKVGLDGDFLLLFILKALSFFIVVVCLLLDWLVYFCFLQFINFTKSPKVQSVKLSVERFCLFSETWWLVSSFYALFLELYRSCKQVIFYSTNTLPSSYFTDHQEI